MAARHTAVWCSNRLPSIFYLNSICDRLVFSPAEYRRMRRLLLTAVLLLLSAPIHAQSVSKILKNAEKALGGEKAFRAIRSMQATGTVTRALDGASGKYVVRYAKPGQLNIA